MNCKNCNSPLPEGTVFCPNCGQKSEEAVTPMVPEQPVVTEPVTNAQPEVLTVEKEVSEAASVVNQTAPTPEPIQPAPVSTNVPEKKSSKVGLIIVIIILGLLVLGLGGFIAYKYLFPGITPTPEPTPTVTPTPEPTPTTTTEEDYMVVGNSTLGYLKLPGKWTKGSVSGAAETAIQYVDDATIASTAKGSYIVTLNVWKEKPDATTAKYAADQEANYYNLYDSDATNISVEQVKLGTLDAYKLSVQYKSDSVWVISWYIDGADGLVHIIQVEGLDLTNDYFKIPETFSFTEIK